MRACLSGHSIRRRRDDAGRSFQIDRTFSGTAVYRTTDDLFFGDDFQVDVDVYVGMQVKSDRKVAQLVNRPIGHAHFRALDLDTDFREGVTNVDRPRNNFV